MVADVVMDNGTFAYYPLSKDLYQGIVGFFFASRSLCLSNDQITT